MDGCFLLSCFDVNSFRNFFFVFNSFCTIFRFIYTYVHRFKNPFTKGICSLQVQLSHHIAQKGTDILKPAIFVTDFSRFWDTNELFHRLALTSGFYSLILVFLVQSRVLLSHQQSVWLRSEAPFICLWWRILLHRTRELQTNNYCHAYRHEHRLEERGFIFLYLSTPTYELPTMVNIKVYSLLFKLDSLGENKISNR